MTRDDFIDRLESYLDEYEGVTPLPDAVRARVRAALPSTKQGGPSVGPLRIGSMTFQVPAAARYGLVAAVLVAAVAVGAVLIGPDTTGGPTATEQPSPTATPSPSAAASASGPFDLLDSPAAGDLPPGEYFLNESTLPVQVEFSVPAGWWHYWDGGTRQDAGVHAILVNSLDTGAVNGSGWGVAFSVVGEVWVDPCDPSAGTMPASATASADGVADAFASWPSHPVVRREDVTLGGLSGQLVELTRGEDAVCPGTAFTAPDGYEFGLGFSQLEPIVNQFYLFDVGGQVLAVWTTNYPGTSQWEVGGGASPDPEAHVEDQVQLEAILDSIRFTPR